MKREMGSRVEGCSSRGYMSQIKGLRGTGLRQRNLGSQVNGTPDRENDVSDK